MKETHETLNDKNNLESASTQAEGKVEIEDGAFSNVKALMDREKSGAAPAEDAKDDGKVNEVGGYYIPLPSYDAYSVWSLELLTYGNIIQLIHEPAWTEQAAFQAVLGVHFGKDHQAQKSEEGVARQLHSWVNQDVTMAKQSKHWMFV